MINRVVLALEQPEYSALLQLCAQELRNPSDQAKYMLLNELDKRGLVLRQEMPNPRHLHKEKTANEQ